MNNGTTFTAAQAAQKSAQRINEYLDMFTAAQAAQKKTKPLPYGDGWFTAAQAAQKFDAAANDDKRRRPANPS